MKTKEQWVTEYEAQRHLPRSKRTLIHSNGSYIEAVQLDAFKAGAEWAAKCIDEEAETMPSLASECAMLEARTKILSVALNLKELPK